MYNILQNIYNNLNKPMKYFGHNPLNSSEHISFDLCLFKLYLNGQYIFVKGL